MLFVFPKFIFIKIANIPFACTVYQRKPTTENDDFPSCAPSGLQSPVNTLVEKADFRTQWYAKTKKDLGKSDISRIDAFETQLKENPYHGRPLGTTFFREKKFDGNRMLFLIYENKKAVFLITVSEKKHSSILIS